MANATRRSGRNPYPGDAFQGGDLHRGENPPGAIFPLSGSRGVYRRYVEGIGEIAQELERISIALNRHCEAEPKQSSDRGAAAVAPGLRRLRLAMTMRVGLIENRFRSSKTMARRLEEGYPRSDRE